MANYIDNKNFLEALIEYKRKCKEAEERGEEIPGPSNYIGECLLLIGQNLSTNRNFAYYPFRDEMISDGYENCLTYLRNFDPEKSKNPFAYYTQITYYAFLRKIQKEKGILVGKGKYVQREFLENRNYATIDGTVSNDFGNVTDIENPMDTDYMNALTKVTEDSEKAKKKAAKEKKK
jgi:hypothetical protein